MDGAATNKRWSCQPTEMETGTEDGDNGRRQRWDYDGTRAEERKLKAIIIIFSLKRSIGTRASHPHFFEKGKKKKEKAKNQNPSRRRQPIAQP